MATNVAAGVRPVRTSRAASTQAGGSQQIEVDEQMRIACAVSLVVHAIDDLRVHTRVWYLLKHRVIGAKPSKLPPTFVPAESELLSASCGLRMWLKKVGREPGYR